MDEVRLLNRALTQAEVIADYERRKYSAYVSAHTDDRELVLHMDKDTDPTQDASGNDRNGTLESDGHPDFNTDGYFNSCFDFDGTQDYISVPHFSVKSFTVGCWINIRF